jgi:hypothetical protein
MTLTLELTPQEEADLQHQASAQGIDMNTLVRTRLFGTAETLPVQSKHPGLAALLDAWIEEDATDDPEKIAQAERETEELLQALQENRVDFGVGHIPHD